MTTRRTLSFLVLSSLVFGQAWTRLHAQELREDFSAVADGPVPESWRIVSGEWQVIEGALVADGRERDGRLVLSGGRRIDFGFAVDVTFDSAKEPSRWVALTFAEASGAAERAEPLFHTFTVRLESSAENGLEHAARTAEDGWDVRVSRPWSRDLQVGRSARLEVQVVRGRVRGLIDGELALDDALAADAAEGELGLCVSGVRAVFDNVEVKALTPAAVEALRVPRDPRRMPIVIAHRGASHTAPENTMSAFRLAAESGAEACEFDVYRTADDQLVLFHDRNLDRTTDFREVFPAGRESRIEALTLEELKRLDAGSWKSPAFRGERIPTLLEALESMRGRITPVIEIKPEDIGAAVAEAIRQADMVDQVFVQSFSPRAIQDVRSALPAVPTGLLIGGAGPVEPNARALDHLRRAREAGASAVVCHYRSIAPEYLQALHRRAMAVWVYTVNDGATLELLRDMGVDGIVTDVPAEALRIRSHSPPDTLVAGGLRAPATPAVSGAASKRVDIVAGEIPVLEFARYYSDALGLPLIAEGGDGSWDGEKILLPSTVRDADAELVKALLEESGYRITERRLRDGRRVVLMARANATETSQSPRETPVVEVTSTTAEERAAVSSSRRPRAATAEPPDTGSVEFRGLTISAVPEMVVAQTELPAGAGAFVRARDEEEGGLAEAMRHFDIITYVGSERVGSPSDFKRKIERMRRGESTYLRVLRKGRTLMIPVRR